MFTFELANLHKMNKLLAPENNSTSEGKWQYKKSIIM